MYVREKGRRRDREGGRGGWGVVGSRGGTGREEEVGERGSLWGGGRESATRHT